MKRIKNLTALWLIILTGLLSTFKAFAQFTVPPNDNKQSNTMSDSYIELLKSYGLILIIIVLIILRLKIRKLMMKKLAEEFGLNFHSEFSRETNQIEGILNGHKINIYDNYFKKIPVVLGFYRYTFVEINGQRLPGNKFQSSFIFQMLLTPISDLRKFLKSI
jgi:hypothetical protein